jgi:prepilin-type N-terminal cleavage/methylation domain-containing protein
VNQNRSGFTLVELLVAVVLLGVGLLALAAGTGSITRTLNGSRIATVAASQAYERMDRLRAAARDNPTPCSSTSFTSSAAPVTTQGVTLTWSVPASGALRKVVVIASYKVGGNRTRIDTLATNMSCA